MVLQFEFNTLQWLYRFYINDADTFPRPGALLSSVALDFKEKFTVLRPVPHKVENQIGCHEISSLLYHKSLVKDLLLQDLVLDIIDSLGKALVLIAFLQ